MTERLSVLRGLHATREFVSRHEIGVGSGLTIASAIYVPALNKALGISNNFNTVTLTELAIIAISASFFAAASKNREKPSDFIKDVVTLVKSSLRGAK